jgi:thiol-disulfide isomerase/thioredoxin
MRFRSILLLILGLVVGLLFSSSTLLMSQTLRVLNFQELEPHLLKKNDTTYVINFWASWCVPCLEEMPAFRKLQEDYKDQKLKILLVNLDQPSQIEKRVIPTIEKFNITSEVVVLDDPDFNSWINKVSPTWSGSIPATMIYKVEERSFHEGSFTFKQLESEVLKKLN